MQVQHSQQLLPCPAEAIVRGQKSGLLTIPDYNNLTQCEALDDIKLNLVGTLAAHAVAAQQPCAAAAAIAAAHSGTVKRGM